MKTPLIKYPLLVAALVTSMNAASLELFKDDKTSVALRGFVTGVYVDTDGSQEINEGISRWGIDIKRQLKNGWTSGITMEWGLNVDRNDSYTFGGNGLTSQGSSEDSMYTRLGYVHFEHEKWGQIGIGKQWSVFYDVTAGGDILNVWGGAGSGTFNLNTDGGLSGVGRAEHAITWRKSYNDFDFGVQLQAQDEVVTSNDPDSEFYGEQIATIGNGYGLSFMYNMDKFRFGVAYNTTEIDVVEAFGASDADDHITAFSTTYGTNEAHGLYVFAMYGMSENHELDDANHFIDAEHAELVVKYTTADDLSLYAGFNRIETDDDNYTGEYEMHYNFIGAEYKILDNDAKLFFEARKDDTTLSNGSEIDDTQFAVGATLFL